MPAWPAPAQLLEEWVAARGEGSSDSYLSRLKPESIIQALSALRSVHVDRGLPLLVFDNNDRLSRIIAGIRRLQPFRETKQAEPLTRSILQQITDPATWPERGPEGPLNLNVTTALICAFAGFLRAGEYTNTIEEYRNKATFESTCLTRSDVTFSEGNDHAILRLKRTKTSPFKEVEVILPAIDAPDCPVRALQRLFKQDPQPPSAPLFSATKNASYRPFTYEFILQQIQSRIRRIGKPNYTSYTGHSPRRGAAQHAHNSGLSREDIQLLGR